MGCVKKKRMDRSMDLNSHLFNCLHTSMDDLMLNVRLLATNIKNCDEFFVSALAAIYTKYSTLNLYQSH